MPNFPVSFVDKNGRVLLDAILTSRPKPGETISFHVTPAIKNYVVDGIRQTVEKLSQHQWLVVKLHHEVLPTSRDSNLHRVLVYVEPV